MSPEEEAYWEKAAEQLTPTSTLARIAGHNKAIGSALGTVGTLLTGAGGVTAAISVSRSTFQWDGIPVVSVGALLSSFLAAVAVGLSLFGGRPVFSRINTADLFDVRDWFLAEVDRGRENVRWASRFFICAAAVAALTSALAGLLAIVNAPDDPRNLATLETTFGEKGAVTIELAGAVDGLVDDEHLGIVVVGTPTGSVKGNLISMEVYPDADGKAALDAEAQAPVGSVQVVAKIWVVDKDEDASEYREREPDYTLTARYPEVMEPAKAAEAPASTP